MQVIGLCRFSYPALGGFQRAHENIEQRKAYLYSKTLLQHRLRLFQCINLPSIVGQTDPDFTYLILTGDDLPEWALERLLELTENVDFITIIQHPPRPHCEIAAAVILDQINSTYSHSIQFRLDDDDAVGHTFVERLKRDATAAQLEYPNDPRFALDYAHGFAIRPSSEGLVAQQLIRKLWTPALAAVFKTSSSQTIMNFGHHKLDQHMPVIRKKTPPMFLRSFHDENDSVSARNANRFKFNGLTDAQHKQFIDEFHVDPNMIRRHWTVV